MLKGLISFLIFFTSVCLCGVCLCDDVGDEQKTFGMSFHYKLKYGPKCEVTLGAIGKKQDELCYAYNKMETDVNNGLTHVYWKQNKIDQSTFYALIANILHNGKREITFDDINERYNIYIQ